MTVKTENFPNSKLHFRREVEALKEAFALLEALFSKASNHLEGAEEIQHLFDDNRLLIDSLSNPHFHVCFGGRYSSGKSTIINTIFRNHQLLPKGNKATTAFPTYIYKAAGGEEERAEITFLSAEERVELKKDYLQDLLSILNRNQDEMERLMALPPQGLKGRLAEMVDKGKKEGKAINKSYECLLRLLSQWEEKVGESDPVSTNEALSIQEKDDNSVIIKEAKVYLKDLPYDDLIVLVDLPGVEADNIRHERITEAFSMGRDSKFFIFVFTPEGIDGAALMDLIQSMFGGINRAKMEASP